MTVEDATPTHVAGELAGEGRPGRMGHVDMTMTIRGGGRVLLVDDDSGIREGYARALTRRG